MILLKTTGLALLLSIVSANAQTKFSLGVGIQTWGLDIEQKLGLRYGICLGAKLNTANLDISIVRQTPNGLVTEGSGLRAHYVCAPLGMHYYLNPRLYIKAYTNLLFRGGLGVSKSDLKLYESAGAVHPALRFSEAIEKSTSPFNMDVGVNLCYMFTNRTQISLGPWYQSILGPTKEIDVSAQGIENIVAVRTKRDPFPISININIGLFRIKSRKI